MSNALTPEQQRAMVAAYTIPLPEPAFGFLVVSGETGQWIESRAGEAAFDADNLHAHAAAVSAAKDARIKVLEEQLAVAAMQLINAIGYIEEARAALGDKTCSG